MSVVGDGEPASPRPRMDRRLLAWLAIVAGIVYLVVLGGSWFGIYFPGLRVASVGMAAAGIVAWAWVARRSPLWRASSVLTPAIAAVIASLAVSTLFSRSPRISLEYLGYTIVLATLYLLLVRLLADPFFRHRLVVLASLLFVAIVALYLVLVLAHWLRWWGAVGRLTVPPLRPEFEGITYGNPSAVLTLVALLAMPTAAMVPWKYPRRTLAWFAIGSVVAVIALLSGSRAGWLALGLTAVIVPLVYLSNPGHRATAGLVLRRVLRGRPARALSFGGALAIVTAGIVLGPAVASRLGAGGEDLRTEYAVVAVRLFTASPIVGTGPGTWVIQRPGETLASENDSYIPHAHNLEVQTLAELGVVGAAAGAFLALSLLRLIRSAARDSDPVRRRWAWAAGIGLLYFVLHQLLDFYPNLPGILFAAVIPVAYLDATSVPAAVTASAAELRASSWLPLRILPLRIPRSLTSALALTIVFIASAGLLLQEVPALQADEAVRAADRGDWAAADGPALSAANMDPEVGSYDLTAGLAAAHAGDHVAAVGYFRAVVSRSDLPEAWLDLAAEQWQLGRGADAATSLARAMRLGFQRPAVSMPAGYLALQMGNDALALDAFVDAVESVPALAGDPWWTMAPENRIAAQVVEKAIVSVPLLNRGPLLNGWEVALMSGQPGRARSLAQLEDATALEFIDAWTGAPGAAAQLFADCRAEPLNVTLVEWCGRVSKHLGDDTQGTLFGYLAETASAGAFPYASELRVNEGIPIGRIEGAPASIWGTFTYRRTTPMDILVPSLLHLTIE
jgi:O-antigen ligase